MTMMIELIKAENGFVLGAYPEEERGEAKYYIAKDSEEVASICKGIANELKE